MLKVEEHLQYIKSLVDAKKAGVAGVEENLLTAVTAFEGKYINPKTTTADTSVSPMRVTR